MARKREAHPIAQYFSEEARRHATAATYRAGFWKNPVSNYPGGLQWFTREGFSPVYLMLVGDNIRPDVDRQRVYPDTEVSNKRPLGAEAAQWYRESFHTEPQAGFAEAIDDFMAKWPYDFEDDIPSVLGLR